MATHTIAVGPGGHCWDRRHSGCESSPASHFLCHLIQEEETPVRVTASVLGDASSSIGSHNPTLSNLDSSLADPLLWETTTSHVDTSSCDAFIFDPDIPIKSESPEFDWYCMTDYQSLFEGLGEMVPTTTGVTLQPEDTEDISKASPQPKMRSASRKPKKLRPKPSIPSEIRQARDSHNNVEKQYRTRLKYHFEMLLSVLQESMLKDQYRGKDGSVKDHNCFSRGEVLDAARQRILALEEENKRLAAQVELVSQGLSNN